MDLSTLSLRKSSSNTEQKQSLVPMLTTTTQRSNCIAPKQNTRAQSNDIVENFLIVWLNVKSDETLGNDNDQIEQLRGVVNTVELFYDVDDCIRYIIERKDEKVFLIVSSMLCRMVIPRIHDMDQIYSISIFGTKSSHVNERSKDWNKITGSFSDIRQIHSFLQQSTRQCEQDSIPISGVSSLNDIDPSFMYTQLFKEFILKTNFVRADDIQELGKFARERYKNNKQHLIKIDEFTQQYHGIDNQPVIWYSDECFTYKMLNQALRSLDVDTLVKMGFYLRDLHENIEKLYSNQTDKPKVVFRGQTMTQDNFRKTIKDGGLISFNSFLSTSRDSSVAISFIQTGFKRGTVLVLFVIRMNRSLSSIPFADITEFSKLSDEKEILFSTHTVFRVQKVKQIEERGIEIQQVELTLTTENDDVQLSKLTEFMRAEISCTGWPAIGYLLWKMGHNEKSMQIYQRLLEEASDENEKAVCYNNIGLVHKNKALLSEALHFHEKAIEIFENDPGSNYIDLAQSYNHIGSVYEHSGDYSKALSFLEKALTILEKNSSSNHSQLLAHCYNNMGSVYKSMYNYEEGLKFYKKSLKIREDILPLNHPDLAQSYNNIGYVYRSMGQYLEALSYHTKALKIHQRVLPQNHVLLGISNRHIGHVYRNMFEYSKAFSFIKNALDIFQKTLPPNHPHIVRCHNAIASTYQEMGNHSKALSSYEKVLSIYETIPSTHPEGVAINNNIGSVFENAGDHSKALSFYKKVLDVCQNLPSRHQYLAVTYSNMGSVYEKMTDYPAALSVIQRSQEIFKE